MSAETQPGLRAILKLLVENCHTEPERWAMLESLCLGVGRMHGRSSRQTAEFVEVIAERLASGERD